MPRTAADIVREIMRRERDWNSRVWAAVQPQSQTGLQAAPDQAALADRRAGW
jgi:hypothetical protein